MVAVKSLWVLLKSFSSNFSFKRDDAARVPDRKPDKRIRYNRLRPQWHRPCCPSSDDPEMPKGRASLRKSYQDNFNGNGGCSEPGCEMYQKGKEYEDLNSDSDYEDGDSDADFYDDFTTTDEDDDSDLDDDDLMTCEVCERAFPSMRKLGNHREKKKHYGCTQCNTILPTAKALQSHREQFDHFEFVLDDSASIGSGSVKDKSLACSSSGVSSSTSNNSMRINNNENGSSIPKNSFASILGKRASNSDYHCYTNQLNECWYEGQDDEEKRLLNKKR